MKATDILKRAKKAIIDHIKYETMLIDTAVNNHESAEEPAYTSEEDWSYSPSVSVLVDNSYLDIEDDTYESRKVVKVSVEDNEKVVIKCAACAGKTIALPTRTVSLDESGCCEVTGAEANRLLTIPGYELSK